MNDPASCCGVVHFSVFPQEDLLQSTRARQIKVLPVSRHEFQGKDV
jgi:hypothetical protein